MAVAIVFPVTPMKLALVLRGTGPFLVGLKWVVWDVMKTVVFFALPFAGFGLALLITHL